MGIKLDIRSISVQLLALVIIVAVVPVIVLTLNSTNTMTAQMNAQFEEKGVQTGRIGQMAFEAKAAENQMASSEFAGDNRVFMAVKSSDKATIKSLVDEYARKYPSIDIFSVADKDGIMMARSTTDMAGDKTTNTYLTKALSGTPTSGTDIMSPSLVQVNNLQSRVKMIGNGEGLGIINAVPIRDEDNKVVGAVFVGGLQNDYTGVVDAVASDSQGFASVFQGDVRVATSIKDGNGNRITGSKVDPAVASRVLNNGETVQGYYTVNGQQLYNNYMPLKDNTGKAIGILAVGYDVSDDMAQLNNSTMISAGIGIVIAIIATGVGFFIVTRVTKPIGRLVTIADSVASGNLETVVETGARGGEVGQLTESTRKMVGNIKERIIYNESILKGITDPLFVVDMNENITYVNETGAKFFGSTVGEMKGRKFDSFFTNLDSTFSDSYMAWCLQKGEAFSGFEIHARLKDGREVYMRGSNAPIKDIQGRTMGAVELLQDITRAKEADQAIKMAEQDAREKAAFSDNILKSIGDMHSVIDKTGKVIYINDVALNTLGCRRDEVIGRSGDDVFGLEVSLAKKMVGENLQIIQMENVVTTRSGRKIPVTASVAVMKDASGNMSGFSGIFRDITKEKEAKKQLQEITYSANKIAERVAMASGNVSTNVGQVMTSSKQISESIQQIASGSQNQAKSIESISQLMHEMNKSITLVNEGAKKTSGDALTANTEARKGSENAQVAMRKMGELHTAVNESAHIVQNLGEKSKKIGQIVDMITAIAGQTNLLALNAAIEAARAGEAGRGFAVVAEEVRKLAEEAAKAAEEINQLIGEVREETTRAVESMSKGTVEVDESNKVVASSLKSLEDIGKLIDTTAAKAQEIAAMAEKQAADTGKVVRAVEEMAAIIEESASSTEEVSASSEESTATAENVAEMAGELAKIADELKAEVGKLKTE